MLLRKGNAGSNTAADHIQVTKDALRQLPFPAAAAGIGRKVLIRTDGGGGTHDFLKWLSGQGLSYSIGFTLTAGHGRQDQRVARRRRGPRPTTPSARSATVRGSRS